MHKILLVDDEPRIIEDILNLYGYETDVATDGYEGLQKLLAPESHYDLLILDIQMPDMNGWEVLKTIRNVKEAQNLLVIMLSSTDEEEAVIAGLRRGADQYLVKPISPGRLVAHVDSLLRRKKWYQNALPVASSDAETLKLKACAKMLTPRENEILSLLVQGCSNADIGRNLIISETTVKNHLAHIFKKLQVSNRTQAAYIAQRLHMLKHSYAS